MNKIILIPAYEPDDKLIKLVQDIDKQEFKVVVVDDGSGTMYQNIFDAIRRNVKVLGYDINQGKGHALKVGFKYIKEKYKKDYIVVTMDSDGQHLISDARKLCDYVLKNPNTLVLGKRIRGEKTPIRSRIGNEFTKFIYGFITSVYVYDTQTGLRAFSDKLMNFHLNVMGERFEYEMNVLLMAAREKIPIHEIEIKTIYINDNRGSHFNTFKDSYLVYKEIIKFSLSSIISFLVDFLLFTIFTFIFHSITLSNIVARFISASVNYTINRVHVFNNKGGIYQSIFSYLLLALFILVLNTLVLNILVYKLFVNKYIAKIITEVILFIFSWFIQRKYIFNNNR